MQWVHQTRKHWPSNKNVNTTQGHTGRRCSALLILLYNTESGIQREVWRLRLHKNHPVYSTVAIDSKSWENRTLTGAFCSPLRPVDCCCLQWQNFPSHTYEHSITHCCSSLSDWLTVMLVVMVTSTLSGSLHMTIILDLIACSEIVN